jgi:uncharacterized protein (DUF2062 family)
MTRPSASAREPRRSRRRRGPLRSIRIRARHLLRRLLRVPEQPHRAALAFSVGVFIAFFPFLGTHFLLVFLSVWLLRLNLPLTLAGSLVNNPWTLLPIYAGSLAAGMLLTGHRAPPPDLQGILDQSEGIGGFFRAGIAELGPFLLPFVVGCLVVGVVAALLSYLGLRLLLRWARRPRTLTTRGKSL